MRRLHLDLSHTAVCLKYFQARSLIALSLIQSKWKGGGCPQSISGPRHAEIPSGAAHPCASTGSFWLSFSSSGPRHFCTSDVGCSSHSPTPPSRWLPTFPHGAWSCALTSVGSPDLLHAVPHEDDAGQLREGLDDVEVAQGAHLEEGHAVLLGVGARLLGRHLPLEGQVQPVSHQDPGDTRGVLQQGKEGRNHGCTQRPA